MKFRIHTPASMSLNRYNIRYLILNYKHNSTKFNKPRFTYFLKFK